MAATLARAARADPRLRLAIYVLLGLLSSGSVPVPFVGDMVDGTTAPVSALLVHANVCDARVTGALLAGERLPGTDVLPSAKLAFFAQEAGWLKENGMGVDEKVFKAAGEVVEKGFESVIEGLKVNSVVTAAAEARSKDGAAKGGTVPQRAGRRRRTSGCNCF